MPQLVGMSCVVCGKRVSSELDARFCRSCGYPVHDACAVPPPEPGPARRCRTCGASSLVADRLVRERDEQEDAWRRAAPPPPPHDIDRYLAVYRAGTFFLGAFIGVVASIILFSQGEPAGIAALAGAIGFTFFGVLIYRGRPR
ncbi:MAG: hypothetical protein K2X82_15190 [Gemmataceae bacterium]|nr:hypothetical protein [Gemmataceae bacterium]